MKLRACAAAVCAMLLLGGCISAEMPSADVSRQDLILVGFSQVGAESEWRVANTENMKATFSEQNGTS
jgi:simple sugar transport system substrate-binding protein